MQAFNFVEKCLVIECDDRRGGCGDVHDDIVDIAVSIPACKRIKQPAEQ